MLRILAILSMFVFALHQDVCAQDVFEAAREGNLAVLRELRDKINSVDDRGFTPLILAVYNDKAEAVAFLLAEGADPDLADLSGNTALMGACFRGYAGSVEKLIASGADINKQNYNGATALIFAATFGHENIAKILMASGADKTKRDNRGKTALDHAEMQENQAMISILKE